MKQELSNTYASRSGLCQFVNGPLGRIKTNLDSVINPYDLIRLKDSHNWFFGNKRNKRK